jgi:predicted  nucleic acid-binding Zn-ribbon protein
VEFTRPSVWWPELAAEPRVRVGRVVRLVSRWASLLAVQGHDIRVVQLARRLDTLPERSQLSAAVRQMAAVDAQVATVDERRDELRRRQQRLEDEIATLHERAARADQQLYSGTVNNHRDLLALQADVASIRRHIGQLEDDELEILMVSEPLDVQRAELGAERERLEAETKRLTDELTAAEAEIATELETVRSERDIDAARVPVDLLVEYDTLRSRYGGVAIARLVGTTCQGCHLQLSAVEIDRIRKLDLDELVHCEACGRLLVRD